MRMAAPVISLPFHLAKGSSSCSESHGGGGREIELGASTCSLLLVGDTSTLHFERSLGGAEYVFLPASKPSLGSSSPRGRSLAVRD